MILTCSISDWTITTFFCAWFQVMETRFIRNFDKQLNIFHSCHIDPTSGHMREKKMIARITERFMWNGVVKDVKQMVGWQLS